MSRWGLCDWLEASITTGDEARRCLLDALLQEASDRSHVREREQPEEVAALSRDETFEHDLRHCQRLLCALRVQL